jgi:hypothetical protein
MRLHGRRPSGRGLFRRRAGAPEDRWPTELLGYKTPGLFFQPPDRLAAAQPQASSPSAVDPVLLAAQAQIAIQREAAQADIEIKREKARADMAIAAFKARQWAEIERFKAGVQTRSGEGEGPASFA